MPQQRNAELVPVRSPRTHEPVVIVARNPDPVADRVQEIFSRRGWAVKRVADQDRVQWVASVHKPAVVVVVAADHHWTERVLCAARAATMAGVVLVGRLASTEVINVLNVGTDAVISDEMPDDEILARTLAVVRRTSPLHQPGVRLLVSGPLRVDLWAQRVAIDGEPMHLSPTEYKLLVFLMRHAGRTMPAVRLLDQVWGWTDGDGVNILRISIARLRRKLGDEPKDPRFVRSVRGSGYSFLAPVVQQGDDDVAEALDQTQLLDSLARIAHATAQLPDEVTAANFVVRSLVSEKAADAAAILRVTGSRLEVVAHGGLSQKWRTAVSPSIPLDPSYASVHALEHNELAQYSRYSPSCPRYARTAALLNTEDSQIGVFIPIEIGGRRWGSLGALRCSDRPYGPATLAYFRSVLAIYGNSLAVSGRLSSTHTA